MIKQLRLTSCLMLVMALAFLANPGSSMAQEDSNEKFANLGMIAVSNQYILPTETNTIVFRIRNNTTRSISQIYGWVYVYEKGANGIEKNFQLLNNPHKGGNIVKGKPHFPGTISEWSFPLVREPFISDLEIDYTLRVHSRSIYFATVEMGKPPEP